VQSSLSPVPGSREAVVGLLKKKTGYRPTRREKVLAWIFTVAACAAVGGYLLRDLLRRF
jgi:hypothetical protein